MPSGTEIPWWEATAARRFSYQNGAPFPKPPVSVTSVDLFPCLQSQLKNERGDPRGHYTLLNRFKTCLLLFWTHSNFAVFFFESIKEKN